MAIAALLALVLVGLGILTVDALSYRAAVRQAASACGKPAVVGLLVERFEGRVVGGYQQPHVLLATRLTRRSSTAVNALHRAWRAKLGPIVVSRAEAAGAFCALAPSRELPA